MKKIKQLFYYLKGYFTQKKMIDPNYLLDTVLNYLGKNMKDVNGNIAYNISTPESIFNGITIEKEYLQGKRDKKLAALKVSMPKIIKKLHEDGLIMKEPDGYSITLNGLIFKETGGYTGQQKKLSIKKRINTLERLLLTVGTLAAGIYALKELFSSETTRNILLGIFLELLGLCIISILLRKWRK